MAFDDLDFSSPSQGNSNQKNSSGTAEKKIYYNEVVTNLKIDKNSSAEIRFLRENPIPIREGYFKGEEDSRRTKSGRLYTPGNYVPFVGDLPGFDGRCALAKIAPNLSAVDKFSFAAFDFRWFHKKEVVGERSISIYHNSCNARGSVPNGNVCEMCDLDVPRVLGGRKLLKLTKNQAVAMFQHDTHIMQFPISENPMEFFGRKVNALSASCPECGEEIFSERKLQLLSPDQVVQNVSRRKHECPGCGYKGKLTEQLVAESASGELKEVRRGDIHCKNVELKREPAQRGTRLVFNSDLLPFESVQDSLKRLRVGEEAAAEVLNREFNFQVMALPYGMDPEKFEDKEKYVKAVTNAQIRQMNYILFGPLKNRTENQQKRELKNPWFQWNEGGQSQNNNQRDDFTSSRGNQDSGFASRFRS